MGKTAQVPNSGYPNGFQKSVSRKSACFLWGCRIMVSTRIMPPVTGDLQQFEIIRGYGRGVGSSPTVPSN